MHSNIFSHHNKSSVISCLFFGILLLGLTNSVFAQSTISSWHPLFSFSVGSDTFSLIRRTLDTNIENPPTQFGLVSNNKVEIINEIYNSPLYEKSDYKNCVYIVDENIFILVWATEMNSLRQINNHTAYVYKFVKNNGITLFSQYIIQGIGLLPSFEKSKGNKLNITSFGKAKVHETKLSKNGHWKTKEINSQIKLEDYKQNFVNEKKFIYSSLNNNFIVKKLDSLYAPQILSDYYWEVVNPEITNKHCSPDHMWHITRIITDGDYSNFFLKKCNTSTKGFYNTYDVKTDGSDPIIVDQNGIQLKCIEKQTLSKDYVGYFPGECAEARFKFPRISRQSKNIGFYFKDIRDTTNCQITNIELNQSNEQSKIDLLVTEKIIGKGILSGINVEMKMLSFPFIKKQGNMTKSKIVLIVNETEVVIPEDVYMSGIKSSYFDRNTPSLYFDNERIYVLIHNYINKNPHLLYIYRVDWILEKVEQSPVIISLEELVSGKKYTPSMLNSRIVPWGKNSFAILYHSEEYLDKYDYVYKKAIIFNEFSTSYYIENQGIVSGQDKKSYHQTIENEYLNKPKFILLNRFNKSGPPIKRGDFYELNITGRNGVGKVLIEDYEQNTAYDLYWEGGTQIDKYVNFYHGEGTLYLYKSGTLISKTVGQMNLGVLEGNATVDYPLSGRKLIGNYSNGLLDGEVSITEKNNIVFKGNYSKGKINGYGVLYEGRLYFKGEFKDNKKWNGESYEAGCGFLGTSECYWIYVNGIRSQDTNKNVTNISSSSDNSSSSGNGSGCYEYLNEYEKWDDVVFTFGGNDYKPISSNLVYKFKCRTNGDSGVFVNLIYNTESKTFWDNTDYEKGWYFYDSGLISISRHGPYKTLDEAVKETCRCD